MKKSAAERVLKEIAFFFLKCVVQYENIVLSSSGVNRNTWGVERLYGEPKSYSRGQDRASRACNN